jgi:hypothetical protein
MNVRKTDDFIADVERQLNGTASTLTGAWRIFTSMRWKPPVICLAGNRILALAAASHTRVCASGAFFLVFRPFNKHILFYEALTDEVVLRRVMHGHRDLPRRLLAPPVT